MSFLEELQRLGESKKRIVLTMQEWDELVRRVKTQEDTVQSAIAGYESVAAVFHQIQFHLSNLEETTGGQGVMLGILDDKIRQARSHLAALRSSAIK